ncbi:unnamed protein product [Brugia timori]|uniref:Uncharacterized protein n=1 Tax=Brugia timori TaxID=42155 RepID=A0A0R3QYX7_9BILA|nr:unnamed protein product [Brugia timori]
MVLEFRRVSQYSDFLENFKCCFIADISSVERCKISVS